MADLSPSTQAVLTAVTQQEYCLDPGDIPNEAGRIGHLVAVALRVAANLVTNPNDYEPLCVYQKDMWDAGFSAAVEDINRKLLAIAAELENNS